MDTRFRPMELSGLWPGDQPFLWQPAAIEGPNPPAREFHYTSRRTSSEFCCLSKQPTVPPIPDPRSAASVSLASGNWRPPALHAETDERLSFFRVFEISSPGARAVPMPLPVETQHVLHLGGSWHATCQTRFCMLIAFKNMHQNGGSTVGAAFVNARRKNQVL